MAEQNCKAQFAAHDFAKNNYYMYYLIIVSKAISKHIFEIALFLRFG